MKLLHGFEAPELYRGGFVSIGNYDGVHRGHQAMVAKLVERARAARVPAVVFTFSPHPIKLLRPNEAPPSLSTLSRKAELLATCGIDCLIAYPTDRELLRLAPEEFFDQIIRNELQASGLVEGPNFFFGHNRAGNVQTLRRLCESAGIELEVVPPLKVGDQ
ncbi:MAG TPA: bifunctional riboflavin kinase/FAD synthetase, partial [Planctomycetaceae bacterium]|nr:bifunctional riboflavin kinase/FAD synthetase [Planctomycetaceae bacterium]